MRLIEVIWSCTLARFSAMDLETKGTYEGISLERIDELITAEKATGLVSTL